MISILEGLPVKEQIEALCNEVDISVELRLYEMAAERIVEGKAQEDVERGVEYTTQISTEQDVLASVEAEVLVQLQALPLTQDYSPGADTTEQVYEPASKISSLPPAQHLW